MNDPFEQKFEKLGKLLTNHGYGDLRPGMAVSYKAEKATFIGYTIPHGYALITLRMGESTLVHPEELTQEQS